MQKGALALRCTYLRLGEAHATLGVFAVSHGRVGRKRRPQHRSVHGGRQFHAHPQRGEGGVEEVRFDHRAPRLPVEDGVPVAVVTHLGPEDEPTPVTDPRGRLVRATQPREDVVVATKPPTPRVAVPFARRRCPVRETPRPPHQRQCVARGEDVAVGERARQQVDKVFRVVDGGDHVMCHPHRREQRPQHASNRAHGVGSVKQPLATRPVS